MLPAFFIKTPAFPDEVLKYREPVDPAELLAGLTLEKLNNIYQSIRKSRSLRLIRSEANLEQLKKKKSVFLTKCWQ